jgi:hypothetical protein
VISVSQGKGGNSKLEVGGIGIAALDAEALESSEFMISIE